MHIQPSYIQTNNMPFLDQPPYWPSNSVLYAGPNDGGIKRGDREDTGEDVAAPDDLQPGTGGGTIDPTSLGGETSISSIPGSSFDAEQEISDSSDGMEIMEANDGRLGLTGLPDSPAEDWAADTGETRNPND